MDFLFYINTTCTSAVDFNFGQKTLGASNEVFVVISVLASIKDNSNEREKPKKKSDLFKLFQLERPKLERFTKF